MILHNLLLISIILKKYNVKKKFIFKKIKKFQGNEKKRRKSEGRQRETKKNERKRKGTKGNEKK